MILRILRYVSPEPWGSIRAEAGRRTAPLRQIVDRIWGVDGSGSALTGGSNVLWTPVIIHRSGEAKLRAAKPGDIAGWMASRQPPKNPRTLDVDITGILSSSIQTKADAEVLFDNRFLMRIRPHRLPNYVSETLAEGSVLSSFHILAEGRYHLPRIVWQKGRDQHISLATMSSSGSVIHGKLDRATKTVRIHESFARITPIRSLDTDGPSTRNTLSIPLYEVRDYRGYGAARAE